jgi:hypothetical protein
MVASINGLVSSRTALFGDLPPGNLQRSPRAVPKAPPQWLTEEEEFKVLERAHQSEAALWAQLGSWDM